MRRRIRTVVTLGAALLAMALVGVAPASAAHMGDEMVTLASPCNASPPWYDVNARLGEPYSFDDGSVEVLHKQWRLSDINFAIGRSNMANTTITMYRSDGAQCGPVTLRPATTPPNQYYGQVGNLKNTGYGIWVCLNWPGGGKCTATKWE